MMADMGGEVAMAACNAGGWIERMRLQNFMCHSNFDVEFHPSVNFITGQNGSGKSAILTGLVIAFGSRAKETERAKSMKELIKTGCNSALIRVEICNKGVFLFTPFKHAVYGDRIILEKRMESSGTSKISLKDAQGHIVSSRKEELESLIAHFNIDVGNPCLVMTQERSKKFLHSSGPADKYQFYIKATQMKQLWQKLGAVDENISAAGEVLAGVKDALVRHRKTWEKIDEELQRIEEREEKEKQVTCLRRQWVWASVHQKKRELQRMERERAAVQERLRLCEGELAQVSSPLAALLAQVSEAEESMTDALAEVRRLEKEGDAVKRELENAVDAVRDLKRQAHSHEKRIRECQEMIAAARKRMQGVQDAAQQQSQVSVGERQARVNAAIQEAGQLKEEADALVDMQQGTKEEMATQENRLRELSNKIYTEEGAVDSLQAWLAQLNARAQNERAAFGGPRVTDLLRVIEENRRRFSRLPVGPLGGHVKLSDPSCAKWAKLVEASIGRILDGFLVATPEDGQLLRQLAKGVGLNIVVYQVGFHLPRIEPRSHELPHPDLPTLLRVLECSNTLVHNALIDLSGVENVVLLDKYEEGKRVAYNRSTTRQVSEVLTLDGYRLLLKGGQEVMRPMPLHHVRPRLGADLAAERERGRVEAEEAKGRLEGLKAEHGQVSREVNRLRYELHRLQREAEAKAGRSRNLFREVQRMQRDVDDERQGEGRVDVSDLVVEIELFESSIKEEEQQLGEVKEYLSKAEDELAHVDGKRVRLRAEMANAERASELATERRKVALGQAAAIKVKYEQLEREKGEVGAELEGGREMREALAVEYEEERGKALLFCPEEEGRQEGKPLLPEQLKSKYERLLRAMQQDGGEQAEEEERQARKRQLEAEKAEKQGASKKVEEGYRAMKRRLGMLSQSLQLRKENADKSARYLPKQLNFSFGNQLWKKGFKGRVRVDYEEEVLTMEVNARHGAVSDVKSLSGGERSFTTLCFALALHELAEAPFRAMDEFDIFMDNVTRNVCLQQAVEFAKQSRSQWIFITPHDISGVEQGPELKKMRLHPPRDS